MSLIKCFVCPACHKISSVNWYEQNTTCDQEDYEILLTLEDDEPDDIVCEHCAFAPKTKLHVEVFAHPSENIRKR